MLDGDDGERSHRARLGLGTTVADLFGGKLDARVSFDGLGSVDWQAYDVKLGYRVSPEQLPGTIDAGLAFDGYGMERLGDQTLNLGFRSVPDGFGGVFSSDLSFGSGSGIFSGTVDYEMKF